VEKIIHYCAHIIAVDVATFSAWPKAAS